MTSSIRGLGATIATDSRVVWIALMVAPWKRREFGSIEQLNPEIRPIKLSFVLNQRDDSEIEVSSPHSILWPPSFLYRARVLNRRGKPL